MSGFVRDMGLAWRLLGRDWRAGEVTLIAAAIVIAVAAVTTIGFFADRVQRALAAQANRLLGADLAIGYSRPLPPELREEARRRGLASVSVTRFPSMVLHGERSMLADVKVVEPGFPLRGELRVAERLFGPDRRPDTVPAPGTVWVDERLHTGLDLQSGSQVTVGERTFTVAAIVTQEPGVSIGFLSGQPRLMMNAADLASTGLVRPGSRVRYSLQVAGPPSGVAGFRTWAEARRSPGERIEGIQDARPEIRAALDRAERFLNLAALASVLLAAAAVALAARRFLRRHLDGCAVMRCLGASQGRIVCIYAMHFALLGIVASLAGVAAGGIAQEVLARVLAGIAAVPLPLPGAAPAVAGLAVGLLMLLGFALPPLAGLARVPALRVMRRELGRPHGAGMLGYLVAAAVVCALVVWRAQDDRLGYVVLGWSAAAMVVAGALAWLLITAVGWVRARGAAWRIGVAGLRRQRFGTIVQVVALALGIMALLTLTLIRTQLLQNWRGSLPPDAPNRFAINVAPDQVDPMRSFFAGRGLAAPEFYPMVRGRLVGINERIIGENSYTEERARRLVNREFNLSWAGELRADNRLVAGRWWHNETRPPPQLSVEQGLATTLGIALGDRLVFDVAGVRVAAPVTSLRAVEWGSFNVNFFVIAAPGVLDEQAATFVTSFHLPGAQGELLTALVRQFPNVVLIDVAQALGQVQGMLEQAALAVQFVFLFTLLAGLVVLYTALASTRDERLHEAGIMRALGASRGLIARAYLAEFALVGALAGLIAALGASGLAWFISRRLLDLAYVPDPAVWVVGVAGGAAGVACAGWLGTRRVVQVPPLRVLQSLG